MKQGSNLVLGKKGEEIAVSYLREKGYKICETNFYTHWGEIDIVAEEDNSLVFVEVKTRYGTDYGYPEEAVNFYKIRTLERAANWYLLEKEIKEGLYRIDVVSIILGENDKVLNIKLFKNITVD